MQLASTCTPFIDKAERSVSSILEKAVAEEKNRVYVNVLSEVKAFIKNFRRFLTKFKMVEEAYSSLRYGRVCFRWVYAENGNIISLVRLESGLSMLFTGEQLRISYNDRSISLSEVPKIGITVNQYNDLINLEDEEEVTMKRSLLLDTIATINNQIEKAIENIELCARYVRSKVG